MQFTLVAIVVAVVYVVASSFGLLRVDFIYLCRSIPNQFRLPCSNVFSFFSAFSLRLQWKKRTEEKTVHFARAKVMSESRSQCTNSNSRCCFFFVFAVCFVACVFAFAGCCNSHSPSIECSNRRLHASVAHIKSHRSKIARSSNISSVDFRGLSQRFINREMTAITLCDNSGAITVSFTD